MGVAMPPAPRQLDQVVDHGWPEAADFERGPEAGPGVGRDVSEFVVEAPVGPLPVGRDQDQKACGAQHAFGLGHHKRQVEHREMFDHHLAEHQVEGVIAEWKGLLGNVAAKNVVLAAIVVCINATVETSGSAERLLKCSGAGPQIQHSESRPWGHAGPVQQMPSELVIIAGSFGFVPIGMPEITGRHMAAEVVSNI